MSAEREREEMVVEIANLTSINDELIARINRVHVWARKRIEQLNDDAREDDRDIRRPAIQERESLRRVLEKLDGKEPA